MKKTGILLALILILQMASCAEPGADKAGEITSLDALEQLDMIISAVKIEQENEQSVAYEIRYKSDDCEVVGYVAAPLDYMEQEYPILIYNRGGNRETGMLSTHAAADYASLGYVALASQYRGVAGGTGTEQFGGDDVNDVIRLIDLSEAFSFALTDRVYMAGHSRGGMMTYIACKQDDRIKAAAVFAGIADCAANYNERDVNMKIMYRSLIGGSPLELPEEYEKRSAVQWADEIHIPLLIIHGGEADWRVPTRHAQNMARALEQSGKEYKLVIYDEADHSLQGTDYLSEMVGWFDAHP